VYWLPTPLASFPFTSPPVRHRVPSHLNWSLILLHHNRRFLASLAISRTAVVHCHQTVESSSHSRIHIILLTFIIQTGIAPFLGTFGKLRKVIYTSVCPSVRVHTTRFPPDRFARNVTLERFIQNLSRKLKSDKHKAYST
jgi:hypothetical protein